MATERSGAERRAGDSDLLLDATDRSTSGDGEHWRTLFESMIAAFPEPVLVINAAGEITHWNDANVETLGIPREDAVGEQAYDVIGTEGTSEILAERVVREGRAIQEDDLLSGTGPDGETWYVQASAFPLFDGDGSVVGAVEVTIHVTDLVEQQEAIADLQRQMATEIDASIVELRDSAETVAEGSQRISEATGRQSDDVREVSREQGTFSATTEEIASAAEEVTGQVDDTADRATESLESARTVQTVVGGVAESSESVTATMDALAERLSRIDEIVDVIDDIADKTNLLSLNASIEAARAGEAGSGFAVVANEVNSLAERSKEEADAIESLVAEIKTHADEAAGEVEGTHERVVDAVDEVEDLLDNQEVILESVRDVGSSMDEIASATDEQAATSQEVASMIDQVASRAEEVAGEAAEVATANEQQTAMVDEIAETLRAVEADLEAELDATE